MSWWWRTKPRSILRTIQWFPFFGELENKNWNEEDAHAKSSKDQSSIHPIRRIYIYNAHSDEDTTISSLTYQQYLSGEYDTSETESNGRNDKTTFEFFGFGYVDIKGLIKVTDVGRRIMQGQFDDEDYLKQLLKLQFPNNIKSNIKGFDEGDFVYPMEIVCKAIKKFEYLNRSEIVLLFGCTSISKINNAFKAIEHFREEYKQLSNKNNQNEVKQLCKDSYVFAYGKIKNDIDSYYGYAEAFCRSLVYTGLFKASGRSIATKIRVPEYNIKKLDMIINNIQFQRRQFVSIDEYMKWYGGLDSITLPWDNSDVRKDLISEKISHIRNLEKKDEFIDSYDGDIREDTQAVLEQAEQLVKTDSLSKLKDTENFLSDFIINIREQQYIKKLSQTPQARKEILDKYDEILDTIDMGALWLEVNTWKSLLAMKGEKSVKRNFNIEEDLSPKSFAPGVGNTPDIEMYSGNYIIIPEVSLMTGVQQWEHEASSVIDHVLSFIKENQQKNVIGLFISTSINIRTKWQFFILNRESWVEKPVPVIPLTIKQYKDVIEQFYKYDLNVKDFITIIDNIRNIALKSENYNVWFASTESYINNWKGGLLSA